MVEDLQRGQEPSKPGLDAIRGTLPAGPVTTVRFHLLIERSGLASAAETTALEAVAVPAGLSRIAPEAVGAAGGVTVEPAGARPWTEAGQGKRTVGVEVVTQHGRPTLLLFTSPSSDARLNGTPAPRIAPLRVGDRLNLGPDVALHVTTYQIPELGPPTADRVGKECPVCRIPFEADSRVFTCGTCATQMHLQGEEKPEPERLRCALISPVCCHCDQELTMHEGYLWLPEGLTVAGPNPLNSLNAPHSPHSPKQTNKKKSTPGGSPGSSAETRQGGSTPPAGVSR